MAYWLDKKNLASIFKGQTADCDNGHHRLVVNLGTPFRFHLHWSL